MAIRLAPVLAPVPSRIGSGSNRRQSHTNNFKKRYSSIETANVDNKSIVVHGSALSKPSNEHTHNQAAQSHANQTPSLINSSTNSFLPIASNQSNTSGVGTMNSSSVSTSAQLINRSNNSSSQTFHSNLLLTANELHANHYENDYEQIEHPVSNNREHSIDEINLITNNGSNANTSTNNGASASSSSTTNKLLYHHSHHQLNNLYINTPFHPHHQSSNHSTLPPIENSLVIKPRISSANNLKQYRDRTDRPMTSAATRVSSTLFLIFNQRNRFLTLKHQK